MSTSDPAHLAAVELGRASAMLRVELLSITPVPALISMDVFLRWAAAVDAFEVFVAPSGEPISVSCDGCQMMPALHYDGGFSLSFLREDETVGSFEEAGKGACAIYRGPNRSTAERVAVLRRGDTLVRFPNGDLVVVAPPARVKK